MLGARVWSCGQPGSGSGPGTGSPGSRRCPALRGECGAALDCGARGPSSCPSTPCLSAEAVVRFSWALGGIVVVAIVGGCTSHSADPAPAGGWVAAPSAARPPAAPPPGAAPGSPPPGGGPAGHRVVSQRGG